MLVHMRVAAIADIHGNIRALHAVLEEIRQSNATEVVVCGDVLPGPEPVQCMEALLGLDIPIQFVHGNGESAILDILDGRPAKIPPYFEEMVRWVAHQLKPVHVDALRTWVPTLTKQVGSLGEVIFCHATPRNDTEVFSKLTPAERLAPVLENVTADVVVCGHTHMQFDRHVGRHRLVNTGSVGHPYGEPGAYWLLLGTDIEFRKTSYDLARTATEVKATSYPLSESWANEITNPKSEEDFLEILKTVEL
jgi:putative phosphoesterase